MNKNRSQSDLSDALKRLGSKPSTSEERGLSLIRKEDLVIFSPGISTAGFAEIRMSEQNPHRKVIATTIDRKGLEFARKVISNTKYSNQINTKLEDLRDIDGYSNNFFDYIYARLVLHYLSSQDLDKVLNNFQRIIKEKGRLFIVVRSTKNVPKRDDISFDENTKVTSIPHYDQNGKVSFVESRYFHTSKSISKHLKSAGFNIESILEYKEQLYTDFMRKEISPNLDHVIEVLASKVAC